VLVNNAAGQYEQREVTVDGLEATFAMTHLSPFLLTQLLLPLLKDSAPARIVNVNSLTHRAVQIDLDDLQATKNYNGRRAYAQAKLANLLTAYELARRLSGTNVHVNVADPLGAADTDMVKKDAHRRSLLQNLRIAILARILTSKRAAKSSIYLASAPDVENLTGKYVDAKCKVVASSPASYDEAMAAKVWHISAKLTGLEQESLSH
jgi:NAD(P)-dependent dehydrogenase (short-subunit alcohol dehydrogenase family)